MSRSLKLALAIADLLLLAYWTLSGLAQPCALYGFCRLWDDAVDMEGGCGYGSG